MTDLSCTALRDAAAELALGILPGDQRAAALGHLEHCRECRLVVEELSDAADALLLLAPASHPPRGFARRVTTSLRTGNVPGPRRWPRMAAVAAAAAVVVGVGIGAAAHMLDPGDPSNPAPFAVTGPGVSVAALVASGAERLSGQVFSYPERPSWLFMTVRDEGSTGTYGCQVELADGRRIDIGSFQLNHGTGSWGRTLALDVSQIRAVRLLDPNGATLATATLG